MFAFGNMLHFLIQAKADAGGIKLHAGMDNAASIHLVGYGMTFDGGDQNDSFLFNNSPIEFENITSGPRAKRHGMHIACGAEASSRSTVSRAHT